jgi:hypothetical protein
MLGPGPSSKVRATVLPVPVPGAELIAKADGFGQPETVPGGVGCPAAEVGLAVRGASGVGLDVRGMGLVGLAVRGASGVGLAVPGPGLGVVGTEVEVTVFGAGCAALGAGLAVRGASGVGLAVLGASGGPVVCWPKDCCPSTELGLATLGVSEAGLAGTKEGDSNRDAEVAVDCTDPDVHPDNREPATPSISTAVRAVVAVMAIASLTQRVRVTPNLPAITCLPYR